MVSVLVSILYAIPVLLLLLAMVYGIIRLFKLILKEFRHGKKEL